MPSPTEAPFLIVGLGNPGSKYSKTRHNIGFEVVDALARHWGEASFLQKFHAELLQVSVAGRKVLLMKPQTYMNRSGLAVGEAATFYKIPHEQCLVISDDLDIPAGTLRLRLSGGSGGHNGLKSITDALGSQAFPRVRIGIGRIPNVPADVYVLSKIPKAEETLYSDAVQHAVKAVEAVLTDGFEKAMNTFNQKR